MKEITQQMQETLDRMFEVAGGAHVVNVEMELTKFPGGMQQTRFCVRIGDIMKNNCLALKTSLSECEAKILKDLPWMLENTEHEMKQLLCLAKKHGVKIIEDSAA